LGVFAATGETDFELFHYSLLVRRYFVNVFYNQHSLASASKKIFMEQIPENVV